MVEPIKWRILTNNYDHDSNSETDGKKLLLADNILTGCIYYDSVDLSGNCGFISFMIELD